MRLGEGVNGVRECRKKALVERQLNIFEHSESPLIIQTKSVIFTPSPLGGVEAAMKHEDPLKRPKAICAASSAWSEKIPTA